MSEPTIPVVLYRRATKYVGPNYLDYLICGVCGACLIKSGRVDVPDPTVTHTAWHEKIGA